MDGFDADAVVVGAGPAGLIAAETVAAAGYRVCVFDHMAGPARKFLLAGKSGLNLTHSEPLDSFVAKYGPHAAFFGDCVAAFSPDDLRGWAHGLGVETFVGSSGRVFPVSMKGSVLVRAWLRRLDALGVTLHRHHRWTGWNGEGALRFATATGDLAVRARAALLALGGASWPRTGSDGAWTALLAAEGVDLAPFRPANAGFEVAWSDRFRDGNEGRPIKGVALTVGAVRRRGEFVVTRYGVEGSAVYAFGAALRDGIERDGTAVLSLDLKPDVAAADVLARLARPRGADSLSNAVRKALRLPPANFDLLRELTSREEFQDPVRLARRVKALPLVLTAVRPLDRAISSAGGVRFEAVDTALMLNRRPGVFVAGEMLDWEAPTGGYLLQGCFSTGVRAARGMIGWLNRANA